MICDVSDVKSVRNVLRTIIIKTSFPPLTFLYKAIYAISVKLAVLMLKNIKGVETIYLRRGMAKNEIVYGLSDIDLSIIIDDEENTESAKEKVVSIYKRLSHFIPIFGDVNRELGVYSTSQFFRLYEQNPFFKYRFNQGKCSWKLLFGKDIVKDLPEQPDRELYLPATEELKTWHHSLSFEFSPCRPPSQAQRKYLWYKAIADSSEVYLFVCHGEKVYDRHDALNRIKRYLTQEQNRCISKIERYVKNLTSSENFMVDDLMRLFIDLTCHAFSKMEKEAYRRKVGKKAILSSLNCNDLVVDKRASTVVDAIEKHVQRELKSYLDYAALIPQVYFGPDVLHNSDIDSMHIVLIERERIPVKRLKYFVSLFQQNLSSQEIEPFIKVGDIALSLWARIEHQCIKSPRQCPLFYCLLSQLPLTIIKKSDEKRTFQCDLPPHFEEYIRIRIKKINEVISDPNVYKLRPLSFLRFFWGTARTKLINSSPEERGVVIPLTSRQICEMASRFSPEDAEWLNDLYTEYSKELQGKESQAYRLIAKSVDFLRRI